MLLTPSSDKTLAVLQLSAVSLSSSLPGRESSPAFGLNPFAVGKKNNILIILKHIYYSFKACNMSLKVFCSTFLYLFYFTVYETFKNSMSEFLFFITVNTKSSFFLHWCILILINLEWVWTWWNYQNGKYAGIYGSPELHHGTNVWANWNQFWEITHFSM